MPLNENEQITTIRMDATYWAKFRAIAEREDLTASQKLRHLIRREVERDEADQVAA
jgi:predicted DNA-binding ribbon-helix-helix protein